jgi:hypothetical protein
MPIQRGYNQQSYLPNYFPQDYTSPQGMSQMQSNMGNLHMYGPDGNYLPEHQQKFDDYIAGVNMKPDPTGRYAQTPPPVLGTPATGPAPGAATPAVLTQQGPAPIVESVGQAPMNPQQAAAFEAANPQIYDDDTEVTSGRRDGTQMGRANKGSGYQKIGLNERLIRLGGAMQGASHLGGNAAMGAFGQEYANIQNSDRSGLAAYEQSQMDYQTALAKAKGDGGEAQETLMQYDTAIAEMDKLYNDIATAGDSLTGLKDGTWGRFVDRMSGDPKAVTRMQMEQFKVDQILISIAQTKGAISDKEMAIFERPMPSIAMDQEATWLAWIKLKRDTTADIRNRLANGTTAPNEFRAMIPQDDDELFNF